jgi:dihydroxy-acid dehydratase
MDLPAIFLPAGPMLRGNWNGVTLGSGSDVWKYWSELRAETITQEDWQGIEGGIARSPGHCMTWAPSTMTSAAEAPASRCPASRRFRCGFASCADGGEDRHAHRRHGVGGSEAVGPTTAGSPDNAVTTCLALSARPTRSCT